MSELDRMYEENQVVFDTGAWCDPIILETKGDAAQAFRQARGIRLLQPTDTYRLCYLKKLPCFTDGGRTTILLTCVQDSLNLRLSCQGCFPVTEDETTVLPSILADIVPR